MGSQLGQGTVSNGVIRIRYVIPARLKGSQVGLVAKISGPSFQPVAVSARAHLTS
jgi:hypothetical protein